MFTFPGTRQFVILGLVVELGQSDTANKSKVPTKLAKIYHLGHFQCWVCRESTARAVILYDPLKC